MKRFVPLILWLLVFAVGSYVWLIRPPQKTTFAPKHVEGALLVDVPWKHLPDVPRFQFTNQNSQSFDSATLNGKVYAVSFFFATCPTICRDLNRQIAALSQKTQDLDIAFLSLTVDPNQDTPEVLNQYAKEMGAQPGRWELLTGSFHKIKELGEHVFRVVVDKATHTDNILLVDKWGRYRDRFKWDDPKEIERFLEVAANLAQEKAPPLDQIVNTRNALPLAVGQNWKAAPWIRDFQLTTSGGQNFYNRDVIGQVWIGSFFFSSCPDLCPKMNDYLESLRNRVDNKNVLFVSISTDPQTDTAPVLRNYAARFKADSSWLFLTGDPLLIKRISHEFFGAAAGSGHHSTQLFLVDRWGRLRGRFDWQKPEHEIILLRMIEDLGKETAPGIVDQIVDPDQVVNNHLDHSSVD